MVRREMYEIGSMSDEHLLQSRRILPKQGPSNILAYSTHGVALPNTSVCMRPAAPGQ